MVAYKVQLMGLQNNANDFEKYEKFLKQYSDRVDGIRNRLYLSSSSSWSIKNSLRVIADGIDDEAKAGKIMSNQMEKIARQYETTENKICGNSKAAWSESVTVDSGTSGADTQKDKDGKWSIPEIIYKPILAAMGPLGVLILEGIKRIGSSTVNWRELLMRSASGQNPLEFALGKYFNFSNIKSGLSSAARWVVAGITSFISNSKEHEDKGQRFWGETITEAVIKVGEGILITAGVGVVAGAIAAVTGATLPVWGTAAVVALATIGVDWCLDSIVKWATKGTKVSWVEALSDVINDARERRDREIVETITGIGNAISNGIENIGNAICNWGRICFG